MSKQPLSRTSSVASVASDGSTPSVTRRTRKRFTNEQLAMLEGLYHQNSHPSRTERENLAKEAGMETKNVTVWLQNKRQNDRKNALQGVAATSRVAIIPATMMSTAAPALPPVQHRLSISSLPPPQPPVLPAVRAVQQTTQSSHASLDRVASRTTSELRVPSARSSQSRRHNPTAAIWDNSIPSSPVNDTPSPQSSQSSNSRDHTLRREGARPTLEWACANASQKRHQLEQQQQHQQRGDETDEEEEDMHEAITPQHSLSRDDPVWAIGKPKSQGSMVIGDQDEETMDAALALCRLGVRL